MFHFDNRRVTGSQTGEGSHGNDVPLVKKRKNIKRYGTMIGLLELHIHHRGLGKTRHVVTWPVVCLSVSDASPGGMRELSG